MTGKSLCYSYIVLMWRVSRGRSWALGAREWGCQGARKTLFVPADSWPVFPANQRAQESTVRVTDARSTTLQIPRIPARFIRFPAFGSARKGRVRCDVVNTPDMHLLS